MPLVEQTRARTEELFQQLLNRHVSGSRIAVTAFWPSPDAGEITPVEQGVRWRAGLEVGFGYGIDGEWDSSSWPSCHAFDDDERIEEQDLQSPAEPNGVPREFLGDWYIVADLAPVLDAETLAAIRASDLYWSEYRNAGGSAVASTGYGLVAAALAEATGGVITSFDSAFSGAEGADEVERNGQTAEQFLAWWGDRQVERYGVHRFQSSRHNEA